MPKLIPFDPSKHEPVDLGLGGLSTEYLASEYAPSNGVWNIPTIWFNSETNEPVYFENIDEAWEISRAYELSTGNMFPRFNNLPDAVLMLSYIDQPILSSEAASRAIYLDEVNSNSDLKLLDLHFCNEQAD